ncbi:thymidine kinase [Massilia arenosa]|uniref:Thymidine kinase n=1 Tax=Zemynaea arenosa TaxID=2561931 RepID=A0A4Y9SJJ3_9BURK|nr:thymidine kinase [Massilia arenosa]
MPRPPSRTRLFPCVTPFRQAIIPATRFSQVRAVAKLYFRYSAMNAGKSTALLQVAHNYEEQGQKVKLYTAAIDDRYGVGVVTSRLGPQREVDLFDKDTNFLDSVPSVSCVLVDEAQFLSPQQVSQLHQLAQVRGVPVICYGLRSDFRGEPFPGSAYLLALADDIEEIKNICTCGKKATMNIRVDEKGERIREGEQVSIGGNEAYRQACGRCFYTG